LFTPTEVVKPPSKPEETAARQSDEKNKKPQLSVLKENLLKD
jgi:hypothetical protein